MNNEFGDIKDYIGKEVSFLRICDKDRIGANIYMRNKGVLKEVNDNNITIENPITGLLSILSKDNIYSIRTVAKKRKDIIQLWFNEKLILERRKELKNLGKNVNWLITFYLGIFFISAIVICVKVKSAYPMPLEPPISITEIIPLLQLLGAALVIYFGLYSIDFTYNNTIKTWNKTYLEMLELKTNMNYHTLKGCGIIDSNAR